MGGNDDDELQSIMQYEVVWFVTILDFAKSVQSVQNRVSELLKKTFYELVCLFPASGYNLWSI